MIYDAEMKSEPNSLNLGLFHFDLPERWDAHFFPRIESKVRLVKDDVVVMVEYFLVSESESASALDSFYEDHMVDLKRNVNGAIFDEDDTDYEILVENNGEFRRYFFLAAKSFIFRFTLSGSWEPQDEDEIREMLTSLTVNGESTESATEMSPASFNFDYQDWFQVGAMYSMRGGL